MCATDLDLDLDLELREGEQGLDPRPQPAGGEAPGVAWGHAEQHLAAR
jgi:hypothetical protein